MSSTQSIGDDVAVFARLDAKYVGNEYASLKYIGSNTALEDSTSLAYGKYASVNLRAGIDWSNYVLTAFAENLAGGDGKSAPSTASPISSPSARSRAHSG